MSGKVSNERFLNSCLANSPSVYIIIHGCTHLITSSALKVGAPGNLAKTLYESKNLLKFIETVNILLTQINIQEKG